MSRRIVMLFAAFAALPLLAQVPFSITPNRGPVTGHTEVTIKGEFGTGVSYVLFGSMRVNVFRLDENTLRATTWRHLPGSVNVTVLAGERGERRIPTGLQFLFTGKPEDAFEPVLLPIFTPPADGMFGSEFHTDFQARVLDDASTSIYGLQPRCTAACDEPWDYEWILSKANPEIRVDDVELNGTPGTILYLPRLDYEPSLTMNLRVYDTSREAENFGTALPIVPLRGLASRLEPLMLVGIPSDSRFRNTLRIYGYGGDAPTYLSIVVSGEHGILQLRSALIWPGGLFEPGYVELTGLPTAEGMMRIAIYTIPPPIATPLPGPDLWAMVSVTNNETQLITLITPQPHF